MTESSTTQTPDLGKKQVPPKRSNNAAYAFLVLVFRVLLLGIGGSVAGLVGIAIANFYPAQIQEPPLLEKALRRMGEMGNWVERSLHSNGEPKPTSFPSPMSITTPSPSAVPVKPLTEAERQQLQTELSQIKQALVALGDRTASIEGRLGSRLDQASLEARLQEIEQQLNPEAATTATPLAGTNGSPNAPVEVLAASATQPGTLVITLPSDALFGTDQTALRTGASAILDSIVADLQTYPNSTIRIAAYTDAQTDATTDRTRSFAQAQAVKQYLSNRVTDGNLHWITAGYGRYNPIATNDSPVNRQRNRRVEITIDPP